ncbi:YjgF-like protein [Cladochytrium replicatum]|nr:YjgF-like protein [Cladochytrium replicatum]
MSAQPLTPGTHKLVDRTVFVSRSKYEPAVGYARAVRKGDFIWVAGTMSVDQENGGIKYPGDPYMQAMHIFSIIGNALENLGGSLKDVVRVRMFVANIEEHQDEIARAHADTFKPLGCVGNSRYVDDACLAEIEVDAMV